MYYQWNGIQREDSFRYYYIVKGREHMKYDVETRGVRFYRGIFSKLSVLPILSFPTPQSSAHHHIFPVLPCDGV